MYSWKKCYSEIINSNIDWIGKYFGGRSDPLNKIYIENGSICAQVIDTHDNSCRLRQRAILVDWFERQFVLILNFFLSKSYRYILFWSVVYQCSSQVHSVNAKWSWWGIEDLEIDLMVVYRGSWRLNNNTCDYYDCICILHNVASRSLLSFSISISIRFLRFIQRLCACIPLSVSHPLVIHSRRMALD